jgi:hypothetical protein
VICLIQLLGCLGLIVIGLAIIMGLLKPAEALLRIGTFLLVLLLGLAVLTVLVKGVVIPAATVVWPATKHLLVFAAFILAMLFIAWAVAGAFELYRNRNSDEQRVHSGEE